MAIRHVATLTIEDGIVQVSGGDTSVGESVVSPHYRFRGVKLEFSSGLKSKILGWLLALSGLDPEEVRRLISGEGVFEDITLRSDQLWWEERNLSKLRGRRRREREEVLRRQREELLKEEARRVYQLDRGLKQALAGASMRTLLEHQEEVPLFIGSEPAVLEWLYRGGIWRANQPYTAEEVKLLVWEKTERERRKFERLSKQMEAAGEIDEARRERIPEDVRTFVWRRDGGKCVRCGRTENLEYDHIIPVSKGGSSMARNVQLLCVECNRRKSDHI